METREELHPGTVKTLFSLSLFLLCSFSAIALPDTCVIQSCYGEMRIYQVESFAPTLYYSTEGEDPVLLDTIYPSTCSPSITIDTAFWMQVKDDNPEELVIILNVSPGCDTGLPFVTVLIYSNEFLFCSKKELRLLSDYSFEYWPVLPIEKSRVQIIGEIQRRKEKPKGPK
jgi:hypothetical protein